MDTLLATYLRESKFTQTELADRLGVPQALISTWAKGVRKPNLENAFAIERLTGGRIPASYWAELELPPKSPRRQANVSAAKPKTNGRRRSRAA